MAAGRLLPRLVLVLVVVQLAAGLAEAEGAPARLSCDAGWHGLGCQARVLADEREASLDAPSPGVERPTLTAAADVPLRGPEAEIRAYALARDARDRAPRAPALDLELLGCDGSHPPGLFLERSLCMEWQTDGSLPTPPALERCGFRQTYHGTAWIPGETERCIWQTANGAVQRLFDDSLFLSVASPLQPVAVRVDGSSWVPSALNLDTDAFSPIADAWLLLDRLFAERDALRTLVPGVSFDVEPTLPEASAPDPNVGVAVRDASLSARRDAIAGALETADAPNPPRPSAAVSPTLANPETAALLVPSLAASRSVVSEAAARAPPPEWLRGGTLVSLILAGATAAMAAAATLLYHRIRPDSALRQDLRASIHERLLRQEGVVASHLAREFGVDRTTVAHHLRTLLRLGLARRTVVGRAILWTSPGRSEPLSRGVVSPPARRVLEAVALQPGGTLHDYARVLGHSRARVHYHLRLLAASGELRRDDSDGSPRYRLPTMTAGSGRAGGG